MKRQLTALIFSLLSGWFFTTDTFADEVLSIVSQNLKHFYDNLDGGGKRETIISAERYQYRLNLAARKILGQYRSPQVIALQEVENLKVLQDLVNQIKISGGENYRPILLEGNDISGIDVGFLVRSNLKISQYRQLFKQERFGSGLAPLFSRPPLLIEICLNRCLTLVNLHLRSMRGLSSGKKGKRVAEKRRAQAQYLARWINSFQNQHPNESLMIVGDLNALRPPDRYSDIVGTLIGNPDNTNSRYPTEDWIDRDLIDLTQNINTSRRFSFVYKGKKQVLDYMLVSEGYEENLLLIEFTPIDRKLSDHAGLLAQFNW